MPLQRVEHPELGITWYRFADTDIGPQPGFTHAMITRLGGVSRSPFAALNLGSTVGDDAAAVEKNHHRLFTALGISRAQVVSPHQVHDRHVATVSTGDGGSVIPATDALITNQAGVALLLRFADCVPVLFYDSVHHAAGLAHAGWRGVAARVIPATLSALADQFGTEPKDLWAGVGPAIGPDHYAVSEEVVTAVQDTLPEDTHVASVRDGQWYLDLPGAVHTQLTALGIECVEVANVCTACRTDEWYSHRAESGKTGRFGVLMMLA